MCFILKDTGPIRLGEGRSISRNTASLNTLVHDCFQYEHSQAEIFLGIFISSLQIN